MGVGEIVAICLLGWMPIIALGICVSMIVESFKNK